MAQVPAPTPKEPLTKTETRMVAGIAGPVEQEVTVQNPNAKPSGGRYLARNIEEAQKRGASATQILEKLVIENQNHPNFQTINTALQRGASHESIVNKILEDNRQKNFFERVRGDIERRAVRVRSSFAATSREEQTGAEAIGQFAAEALGLYSDTMWNGLVGIFNGLERITPDRFDARIQNTWKKLLEEPLARKGIAVLGTGIENWEDWKTQSPENARIARNIEAVFNILEFIPVKKLASAGTRVAVKAGEEAATTGARQIGNIVPSVNLRDAAVQKAKASQANLYQDALNLTRKQRGEQKEILERYGRNTGQFMVDNNLPVRTQGGNLDLDDAIDTLSERISDSSEVLTDILRYENKYVSLEQLRQRALANALDAPGFEKLGTDRKKIADLTNAEFDSFANDYNRLGGFLDDTGKVMVPLTGVNSIKQFFWNRTKDFGTPDANLRNAANLSSGHAMKDTIEELAEGIDVKEANRVVSEFYTTRAILEMRNGARLPNGRLGGMMARLTGAVIGSGAGIEGALVGSMTASKVVELLSNPEITTVMQRSLIRRLEREGKTDILEQALNKMKKTREDFFRQGMLLGPGSTIPMPGSVRQFGDDLGQPRGPETNPFRLLPDGQLAEPFNSDDVINIPPRGFVPRGLGNEPQAQRIMNVAEDVKSPATQSADLLEEARKYKSAEEFVDNQYQIRNVLIPDSGKMKYKMHELYSNEDLYTKYPILRSTNVRFVNRRSELLKGGNGLAVGNDIVLADDLIKKTADVKAVQSLEKKLQPFLEKEAVGKLTDEQYKAATRIMDEISELVNKPGATVELTDEALRVLAHEIQHLKQDVGKKGVSRKITDDILSQFAKERPDLDMSDYYGNPAELEARMAEGKIKTRTQLEDIWRQANQGASPNLE